MAHLFMAALVTTPYITVAFDSSTASGGEGNDTIWLSRGSAQVVYGDAGNDSLEIKMGLSGSSVYGGNATTATSLTATIRSFCLPPSLTALFRAMVATTPCMSVAPCSAAAASTAVRALT